MEFYDILIDDKVTHKGLTKDEFFQTMEELAYSYYQTGVPHPNFVTHNTYQKEKQ